MKTLLKWADLLGAKLPIRAISSGVISSGVRSQSFVIAGFVGGNGLGCLDNYLS